ncbi:MAG: hypothetical protein ACOCQA_02185, partial [bacterium]
MRKINLFKKEFLLEYIDSQISEIEDELDSYAKISDDELDKKGQAMEDRIETLKERIDELEEEKELKTWNKDQVNKFLET